MDHAYIVDFVDALTFGKSMQRLCLISHRLIVFIYDCLALFYLERTALACILRRLSLYSIGWRDKRARLCQLNQLFRRDQLHLQWFTAVILSFPVLLDPQIVIL